MSVGIHVCAAAWSGSSHTAPANNVYRHPRAFVAPSARLVSDLTVLSSLSAAFLMGFTKHPHPKNELTVKNERTRKMFSVGGLVRDEQTMSRRKRF
jgi:hypothetical protein